MDKKYQVIPIELSTGEVFYAEVSFPGNKVQDISTYKYKFDQIDQSIQAIILKMENLFEKVKPSKAIVEFGIELSVESGKLTSLLVSGEGKGSLKITLEWEKKI